jgi:glycosyltransferase involved in cell wall biosynthesis
VIQNNLSEPIVSIIIPCYNGERHIGETIQSVLDQTYQQFEIIVIDDGSTDRSKKIISSFTKEDNRISYYYQTNGGVSSARNNGLKKAKGKYIALLDADDVWYKDNLERKIKVLLENPNISWVFSDMDIADSNLNNVRLSEKGTDKDLLNKLLLWEGEVVPGPCSNIVFLANCLKKGIAFNCQLSTTADLDFCIQLARHFAAKKIEKSLWVYRVLSNSMSRSVAAMEHDHLIIYKNAKREKLFHSFWFKQKCFSNNYIMIGGSWWVAGQKKLRGLMYVLLAIVVYPPNSKKVFKKIFVKK